ncbi:hypothetical protein [Bernardetia sp.]|uniref:hypothetical protein n=1 Tax=Bernardetia sp. TaxID=1937974 RepID=UPI0025BC91DE|nr:hypothetical protein [Bernardetia sp.]
MQQTSQLLRGNYHYNRNAYIAAGEPMIFHCHHYNVYLQAVIEDTNSYLNIYPVLLESAQEIVHTQFSDFFAQEENQNLSIEDKKYICQDYFRFCGFGIIDLKFLTKDGGKVESPSEHYGIGWKSKFGLREKNKKGVAFFAAGYIAGATEAIFGLDLGTLTANQKDCISQGATTSTFDVFKRKDDNNNSSSLTPSPQEGKYQTYQLQQPADTTVDYDAIRQALTNMDLQGDSQTGLIDAFGVLLTRMYANYYCLISYKLLHLFEEKMGSDGLPLAAELLTEAGHVCAYNTFGGIMQSTEWNAMIKPMIQSKEDWVHGITAVVNAFGWGFWEIEALESKQKLEVKVVSGYESNSYLAYYSNSAIPISFLASGGVAGMMNLVYNTAITEKFITLDEEAYKKLSLHPSVFRTQNHICRAKDNSEFDKIVVSSISH